MDLARFAVAVLALRIVSAVVGFLACAMLWSHSEKFGDPRRLKIAYAWGTLFFAGYALLLSQPLAGTHAIVPLQALSHILVAPVQAWALACLSGVAVTHLVQVVREEKKLDLIGAMHWTRRRPRFGLLLLLVVLATTGCSRTPPAVAAEKAMYDAIGPDYLTLVERSPDLSPDQKARRARSVELWRLRIQEELKGSQ
jgi:hypothetical protein